MNSALRKAHKFSWLVLLIIIPLIMFFSIKDLMVFKSVKITDTNYNFSRVNPDRDFENDLIKVAFYPKNIEVILKTTLKNASSTIYAVDDNLKKQKVIGQLTTAGIYNFKINDIPKNILLYDDIKDVLITQTNF
jgi:hypothetical protein